ncbi:hypothetical protein BDV09DRAFT_109580 [Aspergillus tetrazonus]
MYMRIRICAECRVQSSAITGLPLLAPLLYSRPLCRFITLTSLVLTLSQPQVPGPVFGPTQQSSDVCSRSSNGYLTSCGRPSASEPSNSRITWLAYISPLQHCTHSPTEHQDQLVLDHKRPTDNFPYIRKYPRHAAPSSRI